MKQQRYFSKVHLAKKLCLLVVFFLAAVPIILAQPKRATIQELKKIMDRQEDFLIVDVRGLPKGGRATLCLDGVGKIRII